MGKVGTMMEECGDPLQRALKSHNRTVKQFNRLLDKVVADPLDFQRAKALQRAIDREMVKLPEGGGSGTIEALETFKDLDNREDFSKNAQTMTDAEIDEAIEQLRLLSAYSEMKNTAKKKELGEDAAVDAAVEDVEVKTAQLKQEVKELIKYLSKNRFGRESVDKLLAFTEEFTASVRVYVRITNPPKATAQGPIPDNGRSNWAIEPVKCPTDSCASGGYEQSFPDTTNPDWSRNGFVRINSEQHWSRNGFVRINSEQPKIVGPFARVFGPTEGEISASQEHIYDTIKGSVEGVKKGRDVVMFGYGASGSGKTYTLLESGDNPGIMPRFLDTIPSNIQVSIRAIEVYGITPSLHPDLSSALMSSAVYEYCPVAMKKTVENLNFKGYGMFPKTSAYRIGEDTWVTDAVSSHEATKNIFDFTGRGDDHPQVNADSEWTFVATSCPQSVMDMHQFIAKNHDGKDVTDIDFAMSMDKFKFAALEGTGEGDTKSYAQAFTDVYNKIMKLRRARALDIGADDTTLKYNDVSVGSINDDNTISININICLETLRRAHRDDLGYTAIDSSKRTDLQWVVDTLKPEPLKPEDQRNTDDGSVNMTWTLNQRGDEGFSSTKDKRIILPRIFQRRAATLMGIEESARNATGSGAPTQTTIPAAPQLRGFERVKATPNNPESSRGNLFLIIRLQNENNEVGFFTVADFPGVEDPSSIAQSFNSEIKELSFSSRITVYNECCVIPDDTTKCGSSPIVSCSTSSLESTNLQRNKLKKKSARQFLKIYIPQHIYDAIPADDFIRARYENNNPFTIQIHIEGESIDVPTSINVPIRSKQSKNRFDQSTKKQRDQLTPEQRNEQIYYLVVIGKDKAIIEKALHTTFDKKIDNEHGPFKMTVPNTEATNTQAITKTNLQNILYHPPITNYRSITEQGWHDMWTTRTFRYFGDGDQGVDELDPIPFSPTEFTIIREGEYINTMLEHLRLFLGKSSGTSSSYSSIHDTKDRTEEGTLKWRTNPSFYWNPKIENITHYPPKSTRRRSPQLLLDKDLPIANVSAFAWNPQSVVHQRSQLRLPYKINYPSPLQKEETRPMEDSEAKSYDKLLQEYASSMIGPFLLEPTIWSSKLQKKSSEDNTCNIECARRLVTNWASDRVMFEARNIRRWYKWQKGDRRGLEPTRQNVLIIELMRSITERHCVTQPTHTATKDPKIIAFNLLRCDDDHTGSRAQATVNSLTYANSLRPDFWKQQAMPETTNLFYRKTRYGKKNIPCEKGKRSRVPITKLHPPTTIANPSEMSGLLGFLMNPVMRKDPKKKHGTVAKYLDETYKERGASLDPQTHFRDNVKTIRDALINVDLSYAACYALGGEPPQ